jgi:hypothetical protein
MAEPSLDPEVRYGEEKNTIAASGFHDVGYRATRRFARSTLLSALLSCHNHGPANG